MTIESIAIEKIRIDGGTQPRVQLNESVVNEYAEALRAGEILPPVTAFFDGSYYWLADGFHRYHASRKIGMVEISVNVMLGMRRDAVLHSVGANSSHGLRRSNKDKRNAVMTLLQDTEWVTWSDREIARRCAVNNHLVAEIRKSSPGELPVRNAKNDSSPGELPERNESSVLSDGDNGNSEVLAGSLDSESQNNRKYITKHGTEAVMNVSNIVDANQNRTKNEEAELKKSADEENYGDFDPMAEIESLQKEVDRLSKVVEANDALAAAMEENKRLESLCEVLENRMRGYQSSENEAKKAAQVWRDKFMRLEKQVKNAGYVDF